MKNDRLKNMGLTKLKSEAQISYKLPEFVLDASSELDIITSPVDKPKGNQIVIPKSLMQYQASPIVRKDLQTMNNNQEQARDKRTTLKKIIMKKGQSMVEVRNVLKQPQQSKSSALIILAL